jgi:GNAT superfamily N-acetyltransferase
VNVEVVAAAPGDAPSIRALDQHVITATFADRALQEDTMGNVDLNLGRWLAEPANAIVLKAVAGERIVGMVLLREFWNLCNLFVHPAWQRAGVGTALLEAGCALCAGRSPRGAILLNAAPNAVGFYRRLGFVERPATRPLPPRALAMQRPVQLGGFAKLADAADDRGASKQDETP